MARKTAWRACVGALFCVLGQRPRPRDRFRLPGIEQLALVGPTSTERFGTPESPYSVDES